MTIKVALQEAGSVIPAKEAQLLLAYFLQKDKLYLIMHEETILKNEDGYFQLIERARNDEPIEYITKSVSFYSRYFFIQQGALIPRPETEILIDKVVNIAENFDKPHIAEIGVGSGIISCMLALLLKEVHITATDISEDALNIARINAEKFQVQDRITFVHTPYLKGINQRFDIIVSNPPYIANDAAVENNLSYEPDIALFGGESGDEILKEIIDIACCHDNCVLCCEMGYDQKEPLTRYMREKGIYESHFYQDWSGLDRGFTATIGEQHQK